MSHAPRTWYVHKFYLGELKSTHKMRGSFDDVDRLVAGCNRAYAKHGWSYEITATRLPRREFADCGAGI